MRVALKWGSLVGLAMYLVATVGLTLLTRALFPGQQVGLYNPGLFTFFCLGIFGILFACSAAGYFTGRETLRDGYGAVAGMVAFAVYYVLGLIYTPGQSPGAALGVATTPGKTAAESAFAQIVAALSSALIVFGIAALMGWLGGRPGAAQARRRAGIAKPKGE